MIFIFLSKIFIARRSAAARVLEDSASLFIIPVKNTQL